MSHHTPNGSGLPWMIVNDNHNYNYNPGGNITNHNPVHNTVHNHFVAPAATPDAIATIEKSLGQHYLPGATFEAQPVNAGCMPGTRVRFLEEVLALLTTSTGPHIAWVTGMAGTGKTSIALTLCRMIWANITVFPGGSFFCSRSTGTIERTDVQRIIPTLAMLLARQLPVYATALARQLAVHPDAAHWSVDSQVERLLTLPFEELGRPDGPIVFVIDALDECSDHGKLVELIDALADFKSLNSVKFLLTSRPEMFIRRTPISNPNLSSILQLHTIDPAQVTADMHLYIDKTLARASGTTAWYTQLDIEALVQQSCGLFIFASTALKYILDRANDEGRRDRLRKVTSAIGHGMALTAPLDQIYELVLTAASRPDRVDDDELTDMRRVLACILTARASLSIRALADLIEVSPGNLRGTLERLPSLVYVPDNDIEPGIRTLHASFGDYMFDRAASHIRIIAAFGHDILASGCLRRMAQDDLCFNVSRSQSSFEPNTEDAPDWIPLSLLYACLHWAHHLDAASDASALGEEVGQVFQEKLLFWLEVLSVTKKLSVASGLMRIGESVVKQQVVGRFLREASFFVASSYDAIARSAPHIYQSALPFADKDSLIHQYFTSRCTGVVSVETIGIEQHGGSLLMTLTGHVAQVRLMAYSLNGRNLALSSSHFIMCIRDTRTGEEITMVPMSGYNDYILAIAFVWGDTCIAVCSSDGVVRVQDIFTGRDVLNWFCDETKRIVCASFSPDSTLVASGSESGTICVWKTDTGERTLVLRGPINKVTGIAFSFNGRLVVAFSSIIRVWNSHTGLAIGEYVTTYMIKSLAISPDGKVMAAGGTYTDMIEIWDLDIPARASALQNTGVALSLAFSLDGSRVSAISGNHIRFWNCRTKQKAGTLLHGHSGTIHSVAYSPDQSYIASASSDHTIRIWDTRGSRIGAKPLLKPSRITCVAVSRDNTFIVSGSFDGSVCVWNAQSGELKLRPLLGHKCSVGSVAISSNGRLIASGSDPEYDQGTLQSDDHHPIRLWNALTGEEMDELRERIDGDVKELAFSPDASQLASVLVVRPLWLHKEATIHVWNLKRRTSSVFRAINDASTLPSITFSTDGRLLVGAIDTIGQVHIWQTHSSQPFSWPLDENFRFLRFSQDGRRLVTGTDSGMLRISDINSGGLLVSVHLGLFTYTFDRVACSPNGRFIAHISTGETKSAQKIEIWDAAAPSVITTVCVNLNVHWGRGAAFATAGHSIILGGKNKIMVWQVEAVRSLAAGPLCNPLSQLLRTGLSEDGWLKGPSGELLLWVPPEYHEYVQLPPCTLMISKHRVVITADANGVIHNGDNWTSCWR